MSILARILTRILSLRGTHEPDAGTGGGRAHTDHGAGDDRY